MDNFVLYLLKSAAWLSGFAIVYMIFLRKERFFSLKRIYLITGILGSFILPLVTIHYPVEIVTTSQPAFTLTEPVQDQVIHSQVTYVPEDNNLWYIIAGVYVAGIVFLIGKNLFQLRRLIKAITKSKISNLGTAKLISSPDFVSSFSFFNYVFVNPSLNENEIREIMNHELVHVNQRHWFDLLAGELMKILQWANPFAWIYTGLIRLNHEYLADEVALQRSADPAIYKAALLNQLFRSPVISLSNSFNYSITKTRFDMMTKIVTSPYRKLKVLLVLPVFAVILFAFSAPEYRYIDVGDDAPTTFTIDEATPITVSKSEQAQSDLPSGNQQVVKGTVRAKDGKPIQGAVVVISGTTGYAPAVTDKDGNFSLSSVPERFSLYFSANGYKSTNFKVVYKGKPVEITLEKDPNAIAVLPVPPNAPQARPEPLVVIDGVETDKKFSEVRKELGHNMGMMMVLQGKTATDKYGEKGANGVAEITTRKKAIEMGLNPPYPRIEPDDYPTFKGEGYQTFNSWVANKVTYPKEATTKGVEGWVSVNFTIEKDGSIVITPGGDPSTQILRDEIIMVMNSAPKFDPPKNPEANEPLPSSITIGFKLPDQVIREAPYVVAESMPMYPGGDAALLQFIKDNTRYPEELKNEKIEGRVILRFMVNTEGNTDAISILKGVHPVLDAQAIEIVKKLRNWTPGSQGGKPVNVWYMVPVTFTAPVE